MWRGSVSSMFRPFFCAASILAVLVVFRNNVSHSRYNEARLAISRVCAGIRTIVTLMHSLTSLDGQDEKSVAARPEFHHVCDLMLVGAPAPHFCAFRPISGSELVNFNQPTLRPSLDVFHVRLIFLIVFSLFVHGNAATLLLASMPRLCAGRAEMCAS